MGQGTDSCGGYEVDFDEFEEAIDRNMWPAKGGDVKLSEMTLSHMRGARRYCQLRAQGCNFSADAEEWESRADMFDSMIDSHMRTQNASKAVTPSKPPQPVRGTKVTMICHCKAEYQARQADLNRGNGYSCSKRCAGIRREFGRPKATKKKE